MPSSCTEPFKYDSKTSNCLIDDTKNPNIVIADKNSIKYKENMYVYKEAKEHCNNYSEKWQDWFCIKYYYLNNNYEQGVKKPEDALTNTISECLKPCDDDFIAVNNSDKCESLFTFKNKKYADFLPYDPFAIICIIASAKGMTLNTQPTPQTNFLRNDYIFDNTTLGNHFDMMKKITTDISGKKFIWLTDKTDLYEIDSTTFNNPNTSKIISNRIKDGDIIKDVDKAFEHIAKYIREIKSEYEQDRDKIINRIKSDLYKFFVLFDKRDEFYIDYLNHIKIKEIDDYYESIRANLQLYNGKRGGRGGGGGMEYSYNLAKKYMNTVIDPDADDATITAVAKAINTANADPTSADKETAKTKLKENYNNFKESIDGTDKEYIMYLFYYSCDMCFSETSIFRNRLKKYLTIPENTENKDLKFFDYENKLFDTSTTTPKDTDKLIYKPLIPVKIEKGNITIFSEYTEVFEYYKNILKMYPIILLIICGISIIYVALKILNILSWAVYGINAILTIALIFVLFAMKMIVNRFTVGIISYFLIQPVIFLYEKAMASIIYVAIITFVLHVEPLQLAAPANNGGNDYRLIIFKLFFKLVVSIMDLISMIVSEILKNNALFYFTVFAIYSFYTIILKDYGILDVIIGADTSFLNIVDLKYKIYKNELLLDLYEKYMRHYNSK
jgi:hypothetical protein